MRSTALKAVLEVVLLVLMAGCTIVAPKYAPLPDSVNRLRDAALAPVKIGTFTSDPKNKDSVERLSVRGNPYVSPYGDSFAAYLQEALRQDLEAARLLDPSSSVEVTGVLLRNELNALGFVTADAQIDARFVVTRNGQVRFDKIKSAKHEWDSHFVGAIAVPRAFINYPIALQKLLESLYGDPEFTAALRR